MWFWSVAYVRRTKRMIQSCAVYLEPSIYSRTLSAVGRLYEHLALREYVSAVCY